jgi:hypothetical protein
METLREIPMLDPNDVSHGRPSGPRASVRLDERRIQPGASPTDFSEISQNHHVDHPPRG